MGRRFVVIAGPTASGKTRVAAGVARALGSCVISADSMQVYRGMDIGTAKATEDEKQGVPHYMLDIAAPDENYSAAEYQKVAFELIERENGEGRVPVVAGGTGLYIHSLVYDIDFAQTPGNSAVRQKYSQLVDDKSIECLYNKLREKDPTYASVIAPTDKRRIIRRLEVLENGGPATYDFRRANARDDYLMFGLLMPRDVLYERIDARVGQMLENGLVEEARFLYNSYGMTGAIQAIGYKELIAYFDGNLTLEEAAALIRRNTRRYAKRQMTWFRRDERIKWIDISAAACIEETIDDIMKIIKEKGF
jgi:tRNA dimethylallyltransferase